MNIEKLKLWLDFGKFFLGTFLIGFISLVVKSGFESREIAIKETEQIGKYVEHALVENVAVRKRFAEYFKTVSLSEEYRFRWTAYFDIVKAEYDSIKAQADGLQSVIDSIQRGDIPTELIDEALMMWDFDSQQEGDESTKRIRAIKDLESKKQNLRQQLSVQPTSKIVDYHNLQ